MDGEAWWATVHGVAKSLTWLSDFTFIIIWTISHRKIYEHRETGDLFISPSLSHALNGPLTTCVWTNTSLICGFFSINTVILHDLQLVESTDAKPQIRKIDYKVIHRFSTAQGSVLLTAALFKGQLYTVGPWEPRLRHSVSREFLVVSILGCDWSYYCHMIELHLHPPSF